MGVATGCGCKEVYRFPHTTYPYSSCIYMLFFCISIPTFCSLKKNVFRSCSSTFLKLHFRYILNNFFTQYKHIPATTGIPLGLR